MATLIGQDDTFGLLMVLLLAAAIGIVGERKRWFGKISGIIITISITAILATLNVIPSASSQEIDVPVYDWIFGHIVPLSIPLILFNVGLRRVIRESGRLLGVFLLGAAGICLGVAVAYWLLPLGGDGHNVAAVYSATYIGGSVNFIAVADAVNFIDNPLFPATIAIDNVFTNFFLMLLFAIPGWKLFQRFYPNSKKPPEVEVVEVDTETASKKDTGYDMQLMEELTMASLIACAICAVGFWVGPSLSELLGTEIKLEIVIITILVIAVSNIFPRLMAKLERVAFQLGFFLIFLFLATIGAAADIKEIIASSPVLLVFVIITLAVHLLILLLGGRLFGFTLEEMAIASAANVGGSTVSAPMAATFNLKDLITPAIIIGIVGNIIGTFIGIGIALILG